MGEMMNNQFTRYDGRATTALRPLKVEYDFCESAAGSVLLQIGKTKVLCTVVLQSGVPAFMRGKGTGWLAAEYAMLPASTQERTPREISQMRRSNRSVEIARLISRSLRAIIALDMIGERTILVDCDVVQADGGTRTTAIMGAYLALQKAQERWLTMRMINKPIITESVAALSVGILDGVVILDPDYKEDSQLQADFNIIMTHSNKLIEMQGGAEKTPVPWELFDEIKAIAHLGAEQWYAFCRQQGIILPDQSKAAKKSPLFSLQSRLQSTQ
jgi:ribonuclease PH